jgi:hypothetical protein
MELMDKLAEMDESEKNKVILDLQNECACHSCPNYNTCMQSSGEILYCSIGGSDCPTSERKCICPTDCPVHRKFSLKSNYYCLYDKKIKKEGIYHKEVVEV